MLDHLMLFLCTADSTIDDQSKERQKFIMQRFLDPESEPTPVFNFSLIDHLTRDRLAHKEDPCSWDGIECTNGRVTRIKIILRPKDKVACAIEWIPPTVRALRLDNISLANGWSADTLPRDLRFLLLRYCKTKTKYNRHSFQSIDLSKLPSHMEEIHILNSWPFGNLCIQSLPPTMKIIDIASSTISKALIDFENLPEKLRSIRLQTFSDYSPVEIQGMGAAKSDDRVGNKQVYDGYSKRLSRYPEMFKSVRVGSSRYEAII